ncbi:MAG: cytochrome b5 domain-containing protein [Anaerotignum sp.]|nr:cytochrome b5 domain-containing protein [Anaerotignum sp.]
MELDLFLASIRKSVSQMHGDVEKLYGNQTMSEHQVLDHLNREIIILEKKIENFNNFSQLKAEEMPPLNPEDTSQEINEVSTTRAITREELAMSDGKNGNPAYVAIHGFVYDVTNNPAWAAGTHFGLSAGNDLTEEFVSCHIAESVLEKLPVVGFLS